MPAVVAGVPAITVVVPPVPGGAGEVDPAVRVVCRKLGIRDRRPGQRAGRHRRARLRHRTVPRVAKVMGPGSPAVTIAQVEMQRHGVSTVMLLGPTESVVIADASADPMRLAADLLIEAEHGTDSSVVLITTSADLVDGRRRRARASARRPADRACRGGPRGARTERWRRRSSTTSTTAVEIANRYAPEHLQVAVADDRVDDVVDGLVNAGEILIGQHTPFSAANFVIGCPASLPTSGFAHVSSGITAATFLKRTAVARADAGALERMSDSVIALADHEGFPAHAAAIRRRR